jgi:hypothetical protein
MNPEQWDQMREELTAKIDVMVPDSQHPGVNRRATMVLQLLQHYIKGMNLRDVLGMTNGIVTHWVNNREK